MLKTFSIGGVHPPENKFSAGSKIVALPLPKQVSIPIAQHIGAPATAVVAKGDKVKVGQLIAQSSGFVSANIHSSVSGTVASLDPIMDSTGYKRPAITITVEGDEWDETIDRSTDLKVECSLTAEEIIAKVGQAGIVGMGGATFPSQVKLSVPKGKKAEVLIINGVECEPYLTSDHRVMLEKGHELMVGIQIRKKALGVNLALIGLENNKPDAISHLAQIATKYSGIEVHALRYNTHRVVKSELLKRLLTARFHRVAFLLRLVLLCTTWELPLLFTKLFKRTSPYLSV